MLREGLEKTERGHGQFVTEWSEEHRKKEVSVMKRMSTGIVVLALTALLAVGLGWAQQEGEPGEKVETAEPMMSMMMPMCQMMMRNMMMGGRGPGPVEKEDDPVERELHSLGCPGFFVRHAEELGLSDDQVADLKAIRWDHRKSGIKKRAEIQVVHVELEELLDQEPVNFDKVKAKIIGVGDLEQEMHLSYLATIQKARQVLTADQLKKAKTLKKTCCPEKMGPEKTPMPMMKEMMKK